jgi:transposase-like protein
MIKQFSKWLELVPFSDYSNEGATYAFLDRVLNRFGVPAEVLIDQGIKFPGEFQELCEKTLIDHRTTS